MKQPTRTNEALDLANLRLSLREGLKFELREYGGEPCYVVQNQVSSGFFQIGIPEYAFISLLDGKTSIQEAVQLTAYQLGEDAFTVQDGVGTCQWLIQHGFADPVTDADDAAQTSLDYLLGEIKTQQSRRMISQLNPLFFKLPLFNPQPMLREIYPYIGWIASRLFFVTWILVVFAALVILFLESHRLATATRGLLTPYAWIWVGVTMIFMKCIHEIAHGLFCNRYGGQVKEAGVVFILCWPIPYVDVTSCWGFPSKWQRIAVSAAGMYVELFIAALATICWSMTHDVVLKFHLLNIMLTGSVATLLFNANFLMRFDGYYILSDFLEIPNLAQRGQQYLQYLGKRYLLGMKVQPARYARSRGLAIRLYGVLAFFWRIFIYVSLSILAAALFFGFGIALAILGGALWLGLPLFRFGKLLTGRGHSGDVNWRRLTLVTAPLTVSLLAAFCILPWPIQMRAPAFVQFKDPAIVRVETPGFVKEIHVENGKFVNRGDLLVRLHNRELLARLNGLKAVRQQSLLRSRRHHAERGVAAYQSEVAARLAIEKQIAEVSRQLESLTLRSPVSGTVVARDLDSVFGQFVSLGTELLQVVDKNEKEVVVSVGQDDFDEFLAQEGQEAVFAPSQAGERFLGQLSKIEPTASLDIDVRLTSYAAGPLPVRAIAAETSRSPELNLVQPRFRGTVSLQSSESKGLDSGITGQVRLRCYSGSLASHSVKIVRNWIRSLTEAAFRDSGT